MHGACNIKFVINLPVGGNEGSVVAMIQRNILRKRNSTKPTRKDNHLGETQARAFCKKKKT
jgi:hypothetical protein